MYNGYLGDEFKSIVEYSFVPFTALGVAISLFLGFHNNASYSRWWEARTLWGTQIIAVRNLIRFLLGICRPDDDESLLTDSDWRIRIILLAMAQTHALRSQVRPYCKSDETTALKDRDRFLESESSLCIEKLVKSQNPASAILMRASEILGKESGLSTYSLIHASELIDRLCEIQTSCERIHNTTLPFAYSLLVHRTSFMFVYLAPFAIVSTMGWWTPVFTAILAYTLFGLDEVVSSASYTCCFDTFLISCPFLGPNKRRDNVMNPFVTNPSVLRCRACVGPLNVMSAKRCVERSHHF